MAENQTPPRRMSLAEMIILGVSQRLSDLMDVPAKRILPISTNDRMRVAQRVADMKNNGKLELPMIMLHTTTMSRGDQNQDLTGYNARSMSRHGVYTARNDNQTAITRLHLVPAVYEMEVIYLTDSYTAGLTYGSNWLAHSIRGRMNFTLRYNGLPIDMQVHMAPSVTVPERDESVDVPNFYEYDSGIQVVGYVDSTCPDDNATVPLVNQIIYDFQAVTDVDAMPATDPAVYSTAAR